MQPFNIFIHHILSKKRGAGTIKYNEYIIALLSKTNACLVYFFHGIQLPFRLVEIATFNNDINKLSYNI